MIVICCICEETVEAYPDPTYAVRYPWTKLHIGLPAMVMVDSEPHDDGTILISNGKAEHPEDVERLRAEGVPLRRNHQVRCVSPPKAPRKRVWTKAGWRTR